MYRVQKCISSAKTLQISRLAALVVMCSIAIALTPARADDRGDGHQNLGPGCAPDRPAIAHHASGVLANLPPGQAKKAPIPCLTNTGWNTQELSIIFTNKGTALVQVAYPASGSPLGVLRSVDNGRSWDFINPTVTPPRVAVEDMNLGIDRDTGRVFWNSDATGLEAFGIPDRDGNVYIDHSDDDGKSWVRSSPLSPNTRFDHAQIFAGPPPTSFLKDQLKDYPNIVYVAVAGGSTCFLFNFCGGHVTRSLDGGRTFEAPVTLTYPPECPFPGTNPTGAYGLKGVVSRDGTVYLPFTPCGRPYLAVSRDGGTSWQLLSLVAETTTEGYGELALGMDQQENLYAAWTDTTDRLLYLAISRNGGILWSIPQMIAAPGVNETAEPQLVVGKNGQVAVAYYGSKNSPGIPFPASCGGASVNCPGYEHETWNAYITETWDALSQQPLFWSATLNDPAQPVWYGYTPAATQVRSSDGSIKFAGGGNALATGFSGVDYFGMAMAPDNTPWVAIDQECPLAKPNGNPNCSHAQSGGDLDLGLYALVGRLVRVQEEDHTD
jgi:hypothetical protein